MSTTMLGGSAGLAPPPGATPDRSRPHAPQARSRWPGAAAVPYLLVAPALLALGVTVAYPILYNGYISLFDWNILDSEAPERLVGLGNYRDILADPGFLHSLWVTASFTVVAVGIEFVLGLALAMLVNEQIHARRFVRTMLVAPVMATPLVVGLIFKVLWHAEFGVVNYFLTLAGMAPVNWLSEPSTAFAALVVTEVWHNTAFVFLVLLGALQMLPAEPYEAAIVDGATAFQRFRHVTLPLLRPAILVALLFRLVFTIRLFDEVWALTRGGPQSATETVSILIYKAAFEQFRTGYAAALSIVLLALTATLAAVLIKVLYRREPA